MWDIEHRPGGDPISHDLPCPVCGHAAHRFLACSDSCPCVPPPLPGQAEQLAGLDVTQLLIA